MDDAWEAVLKDDLTAAEKYSRRAVDAGHVNPRLWLDHGRILARCQLADEAGEAFRQAIALAPSFGEAFAQLAQLQAAEGKFVQAERLQARAVELEPTNAEARERLAGYRALLPAKRGSGDRRPAAAAADHRADRTV